LRKVGLSDRGVKGKLRQRPQLLGVTSKNSPREVLSEGEQTALGLAGLFTELEFDDAKSAVVLDDPVSSLSHARRDVVAKRIVDIAQGRQVVIFTHDLTFLGFLTKAAASSGVPLVERCIEKTNDGTPGRVHGNHPWKAKDAKMRLSKLAQELADIRQKKDGWGAEEYHRQTSLWAGRLSQTYEHVISSEIANRLFDRSTAEVRPLMFRILPKISEEDYKEFQDGYDKATRWAPRHDQNPDTNPVPPTIEQLEDALEQAKHWWEKIKGYAQ
jgi:hypothetical protein